MSAPQMTTAEALRAALASTIACSAQELQEAVGHIVVATSAECPNAGSDVRSLSDPQTRTTVLLADRIPAGQEAQALAEEIERHHGRQVVQAVLGERVTELLGGDGKMLDDIDGGARKLFQYDGGAAGIEVFFLEETPAKLAGMAGGNAAAAEGRDMTMRPKEYWETRPSPAKPHHWTAEEFAAHLEHYKYPGGTIGDRMRGHVIAIRRALTQGEFVPAVVMATEEGLRALEDAVMEVKSLDEGAFRSAQQKRATAQFDVVCSQTTIENLVIGGAKLAAQAKGAEPQSMDIENYPRPVWCVVKEGRVLIKDTGWNIESLYGTVHEIDRGAAESIVRNAALDGKLSNDELTWFMGSDWRPFAVVQSISSTSRSEPSPGM